MPQTEPGSCTDNLRRRLELQIEWLRKKGKTAATEPGASPSDYFAGQTAKLSNAIGIAYAKSINCIWIGERPPLPKLEAFPLSRARHYEFRLQPSRHGKADLVLALENNLGEEKCWPLILDEIISLLGNQGTAAIRYSQTGFMTHMKLANYLETWRGGGQLRIIDKSPAMHDSYVLALERACTSLNTNSRSARGFTFGVCTSGRNKEYLSECLKSIQVAASSNTQESEIVVCGPRERVERVVNNLPATPQPVSIRILDDADLQTIEGWITAKKMRIAEAARHENLVLMHDRYITPSDTIERISKYGLDYTVLIPRQCRQDGERIPDWVTTSSHLSWSRPGTLDYNDWSPFMYVNGGYFIIKREIITRVPLSLFLAWNEGEDVEHTRRLTSHGYWPRLIKELEVETQPTRRGFEDGFVRIPYNSHSYLLPLKEPETTDAIHNMPRLCIGSIGYLQPGINCIATSQEAGGCVQNHLFFAVPSRPTKTKGAKFIITVGHAKSGNLLVENVTIQNQSCNQQTSTTDSQSGSSVIRAKINHFYVPESGQVSIRVLCSLELEPISIMVEEE